ncbi:MAG: hypothetical protein CVU46_00755 [Chloroflexi bacterium HGW-Chloroflexi-8]|jgi:general stress protein 26|nr:MAG: hypothetical protein CVU46_00755 [Chloroflexi bacterium HGW-Chloroflexi-8]
MQNRKKMTIEDIRAFLDVARIAYLTTIDNQGYPHTVPVWFSPDNGTLIFNSGKNRARLTHIQANSKIAVTIGGNFGDSEGYLIKGEATIEADPSYLNTKLIARRYIQDENAFNGFLKSVEQEERIILRLTPYKVIRVR